LWAAIRATQKRWPEAVCVVYTGDHDADKDSIIQRVQNRFNIPLHAPKLHFLYLSTRQYVLASTWPHFTLLGQSLGSLVLAYDAFSLLVPDIFLDTMGYAFSLWLGRMLFPSVPTGAYVHYPTISTDMLGSLDSDDEGTGVNAGQGTGLRGKVKRYYWHFFAYLYTQVGASIDLVMTNSSWTQMHIRSLWGAKRQATRRASSMKTPDDDEDITVVFPPVAVEELEHQVPVSPDSEKSRQRELLYIAQFRPEKNHTLIINAFAELMARWPDVADTPDNDDGRDKEKQRPHLTLIGSVRDDDDSRRVYKLRLQVYELKLKEHVTFITDASWAQILEALRRASVGVNAMWNEHFGIGVVEYQAAGLISVVHDSGGPKRDIVVDYGGGPTGKSYLSVYLFPCVFRHIGIHVFARLPCTYLPFANRCKSQASTQQHQRNSPKPSTPRSPCRGMKRYRCGCGRGKARNASTRRSLRGSGSGISNV